MAKKPETLSIALQPYQNLEKFLKEVEGRFPECHDFSTCINGSAINAHMGCTACLVREQYCFTKDVDPLDDHSGRMLARLKAITKECRPDMHEPDEQSVSAEVYGDHLDNAMGDSKPPQNCGEYVVMIRNTSGDSAKSAKKEYFNLASLIALARRAK